MTSKSETGHAINVANFNELISYVKSYNSNYNPTNQALTLAALKTLAANAGSSIDELYLNTGLYNNNVAAREVAFNPLSKLVTRIMNMLSVSGVSQQVYDSVNTVARKIKGLRASAKVTSPTSGDENDETNEVRHISTSQMSYDSREENFDKLIQLLSTIPEYTPNEPELQLETLTSLSNTLKEKNNAVSVAEIAVSNSRINRNNILYAPTTGLCDIAFSVKNYIKAVYGATSPQFKQIGKLKFIRLK